VDLVRPAFYPGLPFEALSAPGERRLVPTSAGRMTLDAAVDLAGGGASLVGVELPPRVTGEHDPELAGAMVGLADRLLQRGTLVVDEAGERPLEPSMIGVICAHVSQVHAIQERLGSRMEGVLVETADRFQGLERPVTLVHHPLSGRADADEFHLDAGRLCVMTSRHSVACFLFTRDGIEDMLMRHAPSGDRVLGSNEDTEFEGWLAHLTVLQGLRERRRVLSP
jgi:AAA domain